MAEETSFMKTAKNFVKGKLSDTPAGRTRSKDQKKEDVKETKKRGTGTKKKSARDREESNE